MKQNYLMMAFVSLFAAATFCACDKKDEKKEGIGTSTISGKTDVKVENGSSYNGKIDTVKLEVWYGEDSKLYFEASRALYANGGFTLDLPETIDEKYLEPVGDDLPSSVEVSNSSVKIRSVKLEAYKLSQSIGDFYHGTKDWEGSLTYAAGDVSIAGTYEKMTTVKEEKYKKVEVYKMNLKKGWNIVYKNEIETKTQETETWTTEAPKDAKWHLEEYGK